MDGDGDRDWPALDPAEAEALRQRLIPTGERQYGRELREIKANHLVRYRWAAERLAGKKILDAASGIGYGTSILAEVGCAAHGIEVDADTVRLARHFYGGPKCTFSCTELHSWNAEWHDFDAAVSLETIEHLVMPELFLISVWRSLVSGGKLIFSTPNGEVEPFRLSGNPFHLRHYAEEDAVDLARRCGFDVDEVYQQVGGIGDSKIVACNDSPQGRFWIIECTRARVAGSALRDEDRLQRALPRAFHRAFIERCRTIRSLRQSQ